MGLGNSMMLSFDDFVERQGYESPASYIDVDDYVDLKMFGQRGGQSWARGSPVRGIKVK